MSEALRPFVGFHYDIARGAYLKTEFVHEAIRLAASAGYTHFLPYLETMIRLPSIERACPPCAYTRDDWRAFDATARAVGIELVPWFNTIGHTKEICEAYPELGAVEDRGSLQLDPTRAVSREWTLRCLEEFCAIAPDAEWFVLGGDEWQPPLELLARPGFETGRAWADQINLAAEFLVKRGRKPIVTHDMLWNFPGIRNVLSREVTILFWYYLDDCDFPALDTLRHWGFKTMMFTCGEFGTPLSPRAVEGIRAARRAIAKYKPDLVGLSTWEDSRWPQQLMQIPATANMLLRGEEMSSDLLDVTARYECWQRLAAKHPQAQRWAGEIRERFARPAWEAYPLLREQIFTRIDDRPEVELELYLRHHYPYGPIYEKLRDRVERAATKGGAGASPASSPKIHEGGALSPRFVSDAFDVHVEDHPKAGSVLRFINGEESFEIYPKFGASLQNWRRRDDVIIPGSMDRFVTRPRQPGGYRGYTNAGGFRPIWALGVHNLPCVLWQFPYRFQVVEKSRERIAVECAAEFPHVDVTLRIAIERGRSGFVYEPRGVNKLEHAYASFHWNLPIAFAPEEVSDLRFEWRDEDGSARRTSIVNACSGNFMLDANGPLTIVRAPWKLHLETDTARTYGYLVDWHETFLTPDLHERYVPVAVGETYATRWRMSVE